MRVYRGTYTVHGKEIVESKDLQHITFLLENKLKRVSADPNTWETLYFWEEDRSYWILSYEQPEMQGGGIKVLKEIDGIEAEKRKMSQKLRLEERALKGAERFFRHLKKEKGSEKGSVP